MYPTTEDLKRLIMMAEQGDVDNARNGLREFTTRRPGVLLAWKWLADIAESPRERAEAIRRARFLAPGDPWVIEAQKHRMPPKLKNKGAPQQSNIQDELLPFRRLNAYGTPISSQPESDNLYRPQNPGYTYSDTGSYRPAQYPPSASQPMAPQPRADFDGDRAYPGFRTELERLTGPYSSESRYNSPLSASQPTAPQSRSALERPIYNGELDRLSRAHGEHRHVSMDSDYPISERHLDYSSVEQSTLPSAPVNTDLLPTRPVQDTGVTGSRGMTGMLNGHGVEQSLPVQDMQLQQLQPQPQASLPQTDVMVAPEPVVTDAYTQTAPELSPENRTTMPWLGEYQPEIEIVSEPEQLMDDGTSPLDAIVEQTQKLAASSVTIPKSVFWLIIASTVVGVGLVAAALVTAGIV